MNSRVARQHNSRAEGAWSGGPGSSIGFSVPAPKPIEVLAREDGPSPGTGLSCVYRTQTDAYRWWVVMVGRDRDDEREGVKNRERG